MAEVEDVAAKLAEILRTPDDLEKIPALRAEFQRKKATVDEQLRQGLKEYHEVTTAGMGTINDGQRTVMLIKEEMMKIDTLCSDAQNMIQDFPFVDKIAQTQRNFANVEQMKKVIDSFGPRLDQVEDLLHDDDSNMDQQANLLPVHYELSKLRDARDQAMDQAQSGANSSMELVQNLQLDGVVTLQDHFTRLDQMISIFDDHVEQACMNLISFVQNPDTHGMVVRLAIVVEEEEKKDRQAKALQDASKEFKDLASRLKSMNTGQTELRGYKEKFLKAIEATCEAQFEKSSKLFMADPDKLEKSMRWYFNDLNAVRLGMVNLMPKKWKIFRTYVSIYHVKMHDFLLAHVDSDACSTSHMLAIIHWIQVYHGKMAKLGVAEDSLEPHVIDGREDSLVGEYRRLIVKSVDEWLGRMARNDQEAFTQRKENSYDHDENGHFRTKTLPDMWRMLTEQLSVAASAERTDVAEGVVDAMIRQLKNRQTAWQSIVDSESDVYLAKTLPDTLDQTQKDRLDTLLDWLIAIANDQILCIDDNETNGGSQGYLAHFCIEYEALVTPGWNLLANQEIDALRNGYIDLSTHCIEQFARLLFVSECRAVFNDQIFTDEWYRKRGIGSIVVTIQDYLEDYAQVLHPSLRDIAIVDTEVGNELLVRYLLALPTKKDKGAVNKFRFRRQDPFLEKIKDDVVTVFNFFSRFGNDTFDQVKQTWRAVDHFSNLLSAEKGQDVVDAYARMKMNYWDVQIGWVESVLRCRDDFDRGMLSAVKAAAASVKVERGQETIMSRVR